MLVDFYRQVTPLHLQEQEARKRKQAGLAIIRASPGEPSHTLAALRVVSQETAPLELEQGPH